MPASTPLPGPTPFGSAGWYANPNLENAYAHQWNVEIQHQLTQDLSLSTAYVGSRTYRLDHNGAANTALTPGPGTPDEVRAYVTRLIDVVGKDSGFILSTGCDCPHDAKPENVKALIEVGMTYYPHQN